MRSVPRLTRDTQGVIVMRLSVGDKVAAATVIKKRQEEEAETPAEIRDQVKDSGPKPTTVKKARIKRRTRAKPKIKPKAVKAKHVKRPSKTKSKPRPIHKPKAKPSLTRKPKAKAARKTVKKPKRPVAKKVKIR